MISSSLIRNPFEALTNIADINKTTENILDLLNLTCPSQQPAKSPLNLKRHPVKNLYLLSVRAHARTKCTHVVHRCLKNGLSQCTKGKTLRKFGELREGPRPQHMSYQQRKKIITKSQQHFHIETQVRPCSCEEKSALEDLKLLK